MGPVEVRSRAQRTRGWRTLEQPGGARNGVKERSQGWRCGSFIDSRRVGRRKGQVPLKFLLLQGSRGGRQGMVGGEAVRTGCGIPPNRQQGDHLPQLSHFQQAPSHSHRSIKRKETAGVLGGGEEGIQGFCWLRTTPLFCNHSFPEVALPFRPAQTDEHPPPVASVPSQDLPTQPPPHPHPQTASQHPQKPRSAPGPQDEKKSSF